MKTSARSILRCVPVLSLAVVLIASLAPAGAHINDDADHVWNKHLKTLAQKDFYTKKQADTKFATKGALKTHFDSTVWLPTFPKQVSYKAAAAAGGSEIEVTVGPDGLPVVVFVNDENAVEVMRCSTATCSKKTSTVASFIDATHLDVAIASNGRPAITWASGSNLYLLRCKNATCTQKEPLRTLYSAAAGDLEYASIAIRPNGTPIVATHEVQEADLVIIECDDVACSTTHPITAAGLGGDDIGEFVSIGILGNGNPVLGYYNATDTDPEVMSCEGTCSSVSRVPLEIGDMGRHLAMTIGQDGYPILVFENEAAGLHMWNCNDTTCNSAIQRSMGGEDALHNSISVDGDGIPVIMTENDDPDEIEFIRCGDPECDPAIAPTRNPIGDQGGGDTAVTVATNGLPYIAYYSETTTGPRLGRCTNPFCLRSWSRPQ